MHTYTHIQAYTFTYINLYFHTNYIVFYNSDMFLHSFQCHSVQHRIALINFLTFVFRLYYMFLSVICITVSALKGNLFQSAK